MIINYDIEKFIDLKNFFLYFSSILLNAFYYFYHVNLFFNTFLSSFIYIIQTKYILLKFNIKKKIIQNKII